jgi:O-antigen/teichoic acid export membrane protein
MRIAGRQVDTALALRFLTEGSMKGAALVMAFLLARWLGVDDFGSYAQAQAMVLVLAPIALLGLGFAIVRQIAGTSVPRRVGTSLTTALAIVSVISTLAASAIFLAAEAFGTSVMENAVSADLVRAAAVLLPVAAWQTLILESLRGRQRVRTATVLQIGESVSILTAIVALHLAGELTPTNVILSFAAMKFGSLCLGTLDLFRSQRLRWRHLRFLKHTDIRGALALGIPFMIAGFGEALMGMVDRLVLGNILGADAVGRYAAAQTLVAILASWGAPFWWLLYPRMAHALARGTREDMLPPVRKLFGTFLFFGLPIAAAIVLLGPQLLTLALGDDFGVSILLMAFLTGAVFINQSATPWEYHLYIEGKAAFLMWATLAWGMIAVAGTIFLAPRFGIVGAAGPVAAARAGFALTILIAARRNGQGLNFIPADAAIRLMAGFAAGLCTAVPVFAISEPEYGPALSALTFVAAYFTAGPGVSALQARRRSA